MSSSRAPSPVRSSSPRIRFFDAEFGLQSSSSFVVPAADGDSQEPLPPASEAQLLKERVRLWCINDPAFAQEVLDSQRAGRVSGWCVLSPNAPTKGDGYVQVSFGGANKFAVLQELLLWASGLDCGPGEQASHLCGQKLCMVKEHVVNESEVENQRRKGCLVWVDCPHCSLKISVCPHTPRCVKLAPGWPGQAAFVANGIH